MNRPAHSRFTLAAAAAIFCLASVAQAASLYATSIRTTFTGSSPTIECNLYKVDAATGTSRHIAPIRLDGTKAVAIISLAVSPRNGSLYGITARTRGQAASLVKIDAASGNATLVGVLAHAVSDIGFDPDGRLYGWLPGRNALAAIDVGTAALSALAPSGIEGVMGGGMSISAKRVAYVAATGAGGTLDTIDMTSGAGKTGPQLDGAPYLSAITNLTFSPEGRLYAVNSNMGAPASTALVMVDPASGRVHEVGRLPPDSHALIFLPDDLGGGFRLPPMFIAAIVTAVLVVAGVYFMGWRRK